MKVLKIREIGDPVLNTVCQEVDINRNWRWSICCFYWWLKDYFRG